MVRLEFLNAIDLHLKIRVYWVTFEVSQTLTRLQLFKEAT